VLLLFFWNGVGFNAYRFLLSAVPEQLDLIRNEQQNEGALDVEEAGGLAGQANNK
jgi:hypothetical protein